MLPLGTTHNTYNFLCPAAPFPKREKQISYTIKDSFLVCETIILVVPITKLLFVKPGRPCYPLLWDNGSSNQLSLLPVHLTSYKSLPVGGDCKAGEGRTRPFMFASCKLPVYTCISQLILRVPLSTRAHCPPYLTQVCRLNCQSVITGTQSLSAPIFVKYSLDVLCCVMHFAHILLNSLSY